MEPVMTPMTKFEFIYSHDKSALVDLLTCYKDGCAYCGFMKYGLCPHTNLDEWDTIEWLMQPMVVT